VHLAVIFFQFPPRLIAPPPPPPPPPRPPAGMRAGLLWLGSRKIKDYENQSPHRAFAIPLLRESHARATCSVVALRFPWLVRKVGVRPGPCKGFLKCRVLGQGISSIRRTAAIFPFSSLPAHTARYSSPHHLFPYDTLWPLGCLLPLFLANRFPSSHFSFPFAALPEDFFPPRSDNRETSVLLLLQGPRFFTRTIPGPLPFLGHLPLRHRRRASGTIVSRHAQHLCARSLSPGDFHDEVPLRESLRHSQPSLRSFFLTPARSRSFLRRVFNLFSKRTDSFFSPLPLDQVPSWSGRRQPRASVNLYAVEGSSRPSFFNGYVWLHFPRDA